MSEAKKRSSRVTGGQKTTLIEYRAENKPFARGQFSSLNSRQNNSETWESLSAQLNAQGPNVKTVEQWKKVYIIYIYKNKCWTDIKSSVKKQASEQRAFMNKTGGGSVVDRPRPLSDMDEKVLSIITIDAVDGDGSTPELGIEVALNEYDNLEIELDEDEGPKPPKVKKTQNIGYANALEEARAMQSSVEQKLDEILKIIKEILDLKKKK
ncbi:uncharacterized protein LOC129946547 isoform X1 [Eupeodes corollae]|uniref:uncharacterized protein LOC129946547 isoform X1 n=1 Tax=Eupeodes corollae TaxID=290404 RepID=UPI00249060E0|nr:uncharacterized protein LOC129946547 isoform X1 [Eupeodes corollae]